jgi:hypothetical protein
MSSRSTRPAERKRARRRAAEHEARIKRLERLRAFATALIALPLAASLGCGVVAIPLLCDVPREWYLGLWAGIVGAFVGLTIRLVLERRRYERGTA